MFFFKQKTAYEVRISDWSSDVCSSDLSSFSGLTVEDWAEIARRAVQVNFVKGKELLVQGDPGDMMLILTEGTARVSMLTSGGREIVLAYAEPGDRKSVV